MCLCVSGGEKYLFFGNFGALCFLETPVLRFALLPITDEKSNLSNLDHLPAVIRFTVEMPKIIGISDVTSIRKKKQKV